MSKRLYQDSKSLDRKYIQKLAFLAVLPALNAAISIGVLYDVGFLKSYLAVAICGRFWLLFGASYLLISWLQERLPKRLAETKFVSQLVLHMLVIVAFSVVISPVFESLLPFRERSALVLPRFVLLLQIIIYLSLLRILIQQELSHQKDSALREAELNMLRSQSNPHFLFNTLNLINTEITCDPDNAKEIVFDLSDLLRENVSMAKKGETTLSEELKVAELYLNLQQKRFKDRLSFSIKAAANTLAVKVPALLLQPIVENTVKHAVAPYVAASHINIETARTNKTVSIVFRDSGPAFDDNNLAEGNGFRILRKTLELEYGTDYDMSLVSTPHGGVFSLHLPIEKSDSADD